MFIGFYVKKFREMTDAADKTNRKKKNSAQSLGIEIKQLP